MASGGVVVIFLDALTNLANNMKNKAISKHKDFLYVAYTGENYTKLVGYGDFIGCFNTKDSLRKYVKFIEKTVGVRIDYKMKKIVISEYKKDDK